MRLKTESFFPDPKEMKQAAVQRKALADQVRVVTQRKFQANDRNYTNGKYNFPEVTYKPKLSIASLNPFHSSKFKTLEPLK